MLKRSLCGLAALLLAAPAAFSEAAAPEGYTLAYEDSFADGSLAKLEPTDPKAWALAEEDGNTVLELKGGSDYSPKVRSPYNIVWIKDFEATDFILDVKAKQTGREYGHRDLCLFFGGQDPSHFYYVHLASVADEHANSIFIVDDKPRLTIANERTDGTKWTDDYHHIRLVRDHQTGQIEVYFDDMEKPVMKANNRNFGKGKIGLGSFDDVGRFDDLKIYTKNPK